MSKKLIYCLILLALILVYLFARKTGERSGSGELTPAEKIIRNSTSISYSRHARCRMECRHIDDSEVEEIVRTGKINMRKIGHTDKGDSYPVEGVTNDKQHVRVVVSPHEKKLVIVTVIDLDTEWPCDCD